MANLIWSRKVRIGPENDMVQEFLAQYDSIFNYPDLTRSIYMEPSLCAGFPDVILVFWDESGLSTWNENRSKLTRNDLKILHYLGQNNACSSTTLTDMLGFSNKIVEKSLTALLKSEVISLENGLVQIGDLSRVFFVKRIISIEAKMSNWKSVVQQARLNQLFASESYILMPSAAIQDNLISAISTERTGLLRFEDQGVSVEKEATTIPIPVSLSSWIVNESVGRDYYGL